MIARHGLIYLGSRIVAAAGNLGAIVIFTRLAGADIYGQYTIAMSIAVIAASFAVQWCRYAYFKVYRPADAADLLKTYVAIVAGCIATTMVILAGIAPFLGWPSNMTEAAILLTLAVSVFDAALEIHRTQLRPEAVARSWIIRTGLVLILGSIALKLTGSALVLAAATTVAHLLAALPGVAQRLLRTGGRLQRHHAGDLASFGGPLILSFGITSLAQSL